MMPPDFTDQARALRNRVTDLVIATCDARRLDIQISNAMIDSLLAAALSAAREAGDREGYQRGLREENTRLKVTVAIALQNCICERDDSKISTEREHYIGRIVAYQNVMRWLAEALEREAGQAAPEVPPCD